ncbi:hypothetical protein U0358_01170 [Idiomarina sp. PL1-037]|uniref:hypothetical protein n=1 Tax=Idiomarina sp. PL1-037 TaxID=3095365 RepID=UPI002ACBEB7C|nr:hypothetical protein [Idiomarina sp. PL1-037]WQC53195.1 hypothetical protein U0358_01170 [Idiomarina sp. PL1-037]
MIVSRTEHFLSSLTSDKLSAKDNQQGNTATDVNNEVELSSKGSKLSEVYDELKGKFNARAMSPNEMEDLAVFLEEKGVISSSEAAVMAFHLDPSQMSSEGEKLDRDKPIDQMERWTERLEFSKNRNMAESIETNQTIVNILKSLA